VEKKPRKPYRVLVVDDESEITDWLARELEKRGYDVARAYDGVTGLALAKMTAPDVVLLNYLMPRMDGFQVLAELKSDPGAPARIKVIMMSAFGERAEFAEQAAALGAFGSLSRPHRMSQMFDLVETALA